MDPVIEPVYDDESRDLIEFYESHLEFLKTCPVHAFKPSVLKTVAVMLHSKFYFESDWQEYASEMGVTNNLHLATIQESAKLNKEPALFITMQKALQRNNGNLANIIQAFLNTKRYDVLSYLERYVKKLLEEIPDTDVKGIVSAEQQLPVQTDWNLSDLSSVTTEDVTSATVSSMFDSYTEQSEKTSTTELDHSSIIKHIPCEFNALSKNSACKNPISEMKLLQSSNFNQLSCNENLCQEIILPSAPAAENLPQNIIFSSALPEERISVLIQHTESDLEVARQLCVKLKEGGIAASTLFDMEMLIRMDPAGALSKVFREVDFIVPVVSEEFLQQIDPQFCGDYDAMSNRTLYQLITNEYQYNGCINFRVRSVLVPNMKRCLQLTNNVILTYSFQLWKEFEKLIRILKETKKLLKQYRLKRIRAS